MRIKYILVAAISLLGFISCAWHGTVERGIRHDLCEHCEYTYTGTIALNKEQKIFMDFPDSTYHERRLSLVLHDQKDDFLKEYDRIILESDNPPCCVNIRVCGFYIDSPDSLLPMYYKRRFNVCSYTFLYGDER